MATILTIMATISRLINKIKETLKSVNKLGLAAILVVAGMTMAFKAPESKTTTIEWKYDRITDTWAENNTENYYCDDAISVSCTAHYPEGQNPNLNSSNQTELTFGAYVPL